MSWSVVWQFWIAVLTVKVTLRVQTLGGTYVWISSETQNLSLMKFGMLVYHHDLWCHTKSLGSYRQPKITVWVQILRK